MGVPTSGVGNIAVMSRREDHEVHKDVWWRWTKEKSPEKRKTMISIRILLY
jgi:hypothetical protein